MERLAKILTALIVVTLTGCATKKGAGGLVEAPKPTVDARITQVCDVQLTPIANEPEVSDFFVSYKETVDKLNACACRHREARNMLCKLTEPGCVPVQSCQVPNESSK
jgi:hypothetical protein